MGKKGERGFRGETMEKVSRWASRGGEEREVANFMTHPVKISMVKIRLIEKETLVDTVVDFVVKVKEQSGTK
jgi:hypothetical protein